MEKYDVIVSGLGPAGSSAAYRLCQAGFRVLALEKEKMPRDKLCAGGITTKVLPMLDFDFSDTVQKEIRGGEVNYKDEHSLKMTFEKPAGYVVSRAMFDHLLALRAGQAGADIHEQEPLKGITELEDGVEILTSKGRYRANYLVGADGVNGFSAKYASRSRKRRNGLALEVFIPDTYEAVKEIGDRVAFYYGNVPYGYGWIFAKQGGASVGMGLAFKGQRNIRRHFAEFLETINLPPELASKAKGFPLPAYSWFMRHTYRRGRILLTGDAANLVDPVTGEGIYFAMKSGEVAARAIKETVEKGRRYPDVYEKYLKKEVLKSLSNAFKLTFPIYMFPELSFFALRAAPDIKYVYIDVLLGKAKYKDLLHHGKLSIFQMIKSVFSSKTPEEEQ